MSAAPELTFVFPCLNEEKTLGLCIERVKASLDPSGIAYEIVVADNGSTDRSREIAAAAGCRVVPVAARGYGAALKGGIETRGQFLRVAARPTGDDFTAKREAADAARATASTCATRRASRRSVASCWRPAIGSTSLSTTRARPCAARPRSTTRIAPAISCRAPPAT